MSRAAEFTGRWFRRTPRVRRIGVGILAAFIVIYLAIISYAWTDRLASPRHLVVLIVLWCLGFAALILLARAFRHADEDSRH